VGALREIDSADSATLAQTTMNRLRCHRNWWKLWGDWEGMSRVVWLRAACECSTDCRAMVRTLEHMLGQRDG
jgi:hypothetical protein